MHEESEPKKEYTADRKDGFVDFDTIRILKDVDAQLPQSGFGNKEITFRGDNLHVGIIAVAVAEMLDSFKDEQIPMLVVSERTVAILDALGIQYNTVHTQQHLIHAENIFERQLDDLQQTGD